MNSKLSHIFLLSALFIVVASVLYTNNLANQLADEERKKIEIWAEATRQLISATDSTDINFVSSIIEGNTTIPVYMVDQDTNLILTRNVPDQTEREKEKMKRDLRQLIESQQPIEVIISDDYKQFIYYGDSWLLKQLFWFPYIEFLIITIFILLVLYVYRNAQRAQQNKVWIGLSKETAHQLGTPISSLNAWVELLKANYPEDQLIPEMQKDVDRLQVVAERFGKIGSVPELKPYNIVDVVNRAVSYMKERTTKRILYSVTSDNQQIVVMLNEPLFQWVIENLCKNAIDAIEGEGLITISIKRNGTKTEIDFSDTGKGMTHSQAQQAFNPGFTTKQRGWGLGLSLTKRIIEDYHSGKIIIASTEPNKGTTFKITI